MACHWAPCLVTHNSFTVQQVNLPLQKMHFDYSNLLTSIVNIISILSTFQGPKGKNRLPLGPLWLPFWGPRCFVVKVQWHSVIHSLTSILAYWLCGGSISRRAKCIQIIKIAWTRFKMSMLGLLYWLAVLLSSYIVHINNTTTFNVCAQWNIFYRQFDFVKANYSRQEFLTGIVFMLFEILSIELMSSSLVKQSCKTQKVVLVVRFWLPHSEWFCIICRFYSVFSYQFKLIIFNMHVWNIEPLKFLQTLSIIVWVVGIQNRKI